MRPRISSGAASWTMVMLATLQIISVMPDSAHASSAHAKVGERPRPATDDVNIPLTHSQR